MFQKKHFTLISLATTALFFSACTSSTTPEPTTPPTATLQPAPEKVIQQAPTKPVSEPKTVSKPAPAKPAVPKEPAVDLSQKSETFKSGMKDGCSTAKGKYRKNAANFSSDTDYKEGWFHGRRKCQAHLAG